MRKFIPLFLLSLAAASPALAQNTQFELDNLRAQQEAAQRRSIDQANQSMALEARLRADQAAADAQAARLLPERIPTPLDANQAAAPAANIAKYPSIPSAALADSNRRVQDAAKNHH